MVLWSCREKSEIFPNLPYEMEKKSGNNQHSNSNLCYIKMQVYPWRQPLNHTIHPLLCPKIHSTFHWQHVCVSCSCFRCTVSPYMCVFVPVLVKTFNNWNFIANRKSSITIARPWAIGKRQLSINYKLIINHTRVHTQISHLSKVLQECESWAGGGVMDVHPSENMMKANKN